jgi:hypothetical protein
VGASGTQLNSHVVRELRHPSRGEVSLLQEMGAVELTFVTPLFKGTSAAPDMARVVSALRLQWMKFRITAWIEYVRSAANWSDDPSRGEVALLEKMIPPIEGGRR